jgi:putative ABC transport system permease protein
MGGRIALVARLATKDLRRRWAESLLLLLAIATASAALTLGLVLHGVTNQPYAETHAATRGADVTAESSYVPPGNATSAADLAALVALNHAKGVVAHSGPYPMTTAVMRSRGVVAGANVEGREPAVAAVDQPKVTAGTWIRPGGVVVERTFGQAADLHLGQTITLNGRPFEVVGFAVTSSFSPYPTIGCQAGCSFGGIKLDASTTGLMWSTEAAARGLATKAAPLTYYSNFRLADPSTQSMDAFGTAFGNNYSGNGRPSTAPFITSSKQIAHEDSNLVRNEQAVMLTGATLLIVLSIASVAVLVGGRMADQIRRVGLLKAIGGTPGFVASVLLAQYLVLALMGAAIGLLVGWLVAPVLSAPGAGLLGPTPPPPLSSVNVLEVFGVALGVALLAALVPAMRAARTSTVRALSDAARTPRRSAVLIGLSTRLPVPLLIAVRVMARRLRRTVLSLLSVTVTVSGIVAVMIARARLGASHFAGTSGLLDPRTQRANEVLLAVTLMLVALAAINAVFITRAIAEDAKHASAITRALGATPQQVTSGLSAAQSLPAFFGALLGIPGGYLLFNVAKNGDVNAALPAVGDLVAVLLGAVVVVTLLTAVPARWGARRPVATILQSELA